ncbi:hypothetical protein CDD81_7025 [Ophiocordyceps australis]|uniref:Uncharacterized protein n=1 Tax=Ophiocordyceps australis TaxID=1399860 RepID=A0A2C5YGC7_9HYPO|nr:hypothetical protein CDD81_7025 [Ophiocordyceps australis]
MSVFAPLDEQNLLGAGLLTPPSSGGKRYVHKRRLNRSSDEEYKYIPISPPSSPLSHADHFSIVPDQLHSQATLECHLDFIEIVTDHATRLKRTLDTWAEDDQPWFAYLERCGIRKDIQLAIMDPKFKSLRLTESCYHWIVDTLQIRFRALESVQQASEARARDLSSGSSSSNQSTQQRTSAESSKALALSQRTALSEDAKRAGQNVPGSINIFKGVDEAKLSGCFNNSGDFIDCGSILTSIGSDFGSRTAGLYFAVDRDVAVYYARFIESMPEGQVLKTFWPNQEWKELVFTSRMRTCFPRPLTKFRHASLIIGSILKRPTGAIMKMKSSNEINSGDILQNNDGRFAIQYFFNSGGLEDGTDLLMAHAAKTLKMFSVTEAEAMGDTNE